MLQHSLMTGVYDDSRVVSRATISVYDLENTKIVEDLRMSVAPMPQMKSKATRLLNKHTNKSGELSAWKQSLEYYPEFYRNRGNFQVRIHLFEE